MVSNERQNGWTDRVSKDLWGNLLDLVGKVYGCNKYSNKPHIKNLNIPIYILHDKIICTLITFINIG